MTASSVRLLALLVVVGSGCRPPRPAAADASAGQGVRVDPPIVQAVSPDTLQIIDGAVNTVRVTGVGFSPADNLVTLGPVHLARVRSFDGGTRIELTVPDRVPSGGGAAPMPWTAGRYALTVRTVAGESAPVPVVVRP